MIYCSIQSVGIWRTCFKGSGPGGQMGFSACLGKWTEGRKPSHTHYYQGSWIVVSQCQWENLRSLQNRQGKSSGFFGKINNNVGRTKLCWNWDNCHGMSNFEIIRCPCWDPLLIGLLAFLDWNCARKTAHGWRAKSYFSTLGTLEWTAGYPMNLLIRLLNPNRI